jgi:hypothetical protein
MPVRIGLRAKKIGNLPKISEHTRKAFLGDNALVSLKMILHTRVVRIRLCAEWLDRVMSDCSEEICLSQR